MFRFSFLALIVAVSGAALFSIVPAHAADQTSSPVASAPVAPVAPSRDDGGFGVGGLHSDSYAAFDDPAAPLDPSRIEPAAGTEDSAAPAPSAVPAPAAVQPDAVSVQE